MKKVFSRGFTLIELIVVFGILGALSMLLIATLDPIAQFQKSRDGKRKSDLGQVQKILEQYYQDNGRYPVHSTSSPTYRIVKLDGTTAEWGQAFTPYANVLPKDPISSKNYVYYSSGQSYYLYASLDRGSKDPQACSGGVCSSLTSNNISPTACGGTCNYGVSSPNVSP